VGFAGCTNTTAPTTVAPTPIITPELNQHNVGDIISNKSASNWGWLILKYDPVGDVYVMRGVISPTNTKDEKLPWGWLDKQPRQNDRRSVDTVTPYKIGYISDPITVVESY